ncbi:hypothetical protein WICPIJ_006246 [Wickerhamomyces pijperi]|uniref:SRR1-like domain-containing protein n=1 Tax=Wickerhamomyces pijperi TaxID=599730 RepID=A0A9P8Q270_WICPI|nr:hypothetical protein WICPIJ_006246 [Wickerhamomyces pijperi]
MSTDFIKIERKKQPVKAGNVNNGTSSNSALSPDTARLQRLHSQLLKYQETVRSSQLYHYIQTTIAKQVINQPFAKKITKIRCLALGSPSQDHAAMYQLALLVILQKYLQVSDRDVSIYDPVFDEMDKELMGNSDDPSLGYTIEEQYSQKEDKSNNDITLYFLPHAPLSLTNVIISQNEPLLLLSNNIITHVDRLTKCQLFEKYPLISKFVTLVKEENVELKEETEAQLKESKEEKEGDGFETFHTNKRKANKRQRQNKFKLIEKELDYSSISSYFNQRITLWSFKKYETSGLWLNAFTDLSLHYVVE